MRNERLAVRQRLVEVCQVQLLDARRQLGDRWGAKARLADELATAAPPQAFAAAAGQGLAEAVTIRNPDGSLAYPAWDLATSAPAPRQSAALLQLERDDPAAAQQLYAQAATNAIGEAARASARIAQARCLAAMGKPREAADTCSACTRRPQSAVDSAWSAKCAHASARWAAASAVGDSRRGVNGPGTSPSAAGTSAGSAALPRHVRHRTPDDDRERPDTTTACAPYDAPNRRFGATRACRYGRGLGWSSWLSQAGPRRRGRPSSKYC
jgi:hypothetical protein